MQGSSSSVPPSAHTCVQITRVHFYPLVLVCQAFLSHKAQGRACTEPSPCLDVLSWHGSLLQRPQVSPLHFEFISLERIVLQHTQGKEADGSAVAGACSLLLSSSRWNSFLCISQSRVERVVPVPWHCCTKSWAHLVGTVLGAVGFCNSLRLNYQGPKL